MPAEAPGTLLNRASPEIRARVSSLRVVRDVIASSESSPAAHPCAASFLPPAGETHPRTFVQQLGGAIGWRTGTAGLTRRRYFAHVRLPSLDTKSALRPAVEGFVAESRSRKPEPLDRRERNVELARIAVLAAACAGIAAVTDEAPPFDLGLALALTVAYGLAGLVRFEVGAGWMVPTQVVFIPMLLLLPPWVAPVGVAVGTVLSDLPAVVRRHVHPDRLLIAPASAWYAVGPALVLALVGSSGLSWGDAWVYVLAFAAQVVFDVAASTGREWFVFGVPPRLQFAVLARVYMVDALLTP